MTESWTDRNVWYEAALEWEKKFVDRYGKRFGIIINPSKEVDKYAPDLYCLKTYINADLKYHAIPFFLSQEKFGIDPNYCWTFDHADFLDYSFSHDDRFGIFVWVQHEAQLDFGVLIRKQEAIYFTTLGKLKDFLKKHGVIHKHIRRMNDTSGNSYGNYPIDLRSGIFTRIHNE